MPGTTTTTEIRLPPLEEIWQWPRMVSPHLAELEEECLQWTASFGAFDPETQRRIHDKGKLNLLAGMCYARLSREQVRSGCDIMHLFFMFDEYSDGGATPEEVWNQARVLTDAMTYPDKPRPEGEWVGGEVARQFWQRLPKTYTEPFRRRFLKTWVDYVEAVARQAENRAVSRVLDPDNYIVLRRDTSGAPSTLVMCELDLDIPDEIREHPIIDELFTLATDLILIANDILSYNKEQAACDAEHNLITVIMNQFQLDVQQAIDKAGEMCREKTDRFNTLYRQVPRWGGPVDLDVQRFVDGLAVCVGGTLHWSYESQRYFGTHGMEIKKTRTMRLFPQKSEVNGTGK